MRGSLLQWTIFKFCETTRSRKNSGSKNRVIAYPWRLPDDYFGGDGETRTLTGYPIRPSNVRVYQFRHIPVNIVSVMLYSFRAACR